jgi:hypothetical protein
VVEGTEGVNKLQKLISTFISTVKMMKMMSEANLCEDEGKHSIDS